MYYLQALWYTQKIFLTCWRNYNIADNNHNCIIKVGIGTLFCKDGNCIWNRQQAFHWHVPSPNGQTNKYKLFAFIKIWFDLLKKNNKNSTVRFPRNSKYCLTSIQLDTFSIELYFVVSKLGRGNNVQVNRPRHYLLLCCFRVKTWCWNKKLNWSFSIKVIEIQVTISSNAFLFWKVYPSISLTQGQYIHTMQAILHSYFPLTSWKCFQLVLLIGNVTSSLPFIYSSQLKNKLVIPNHGRTRQFVVILCGLSFYITYLVYVIVDDLSNNVWKIDEDVIIRLLYLMASALTLILYGNLWICTKAFAFYINEWIHLYKMIEGNVTLNSNIGNKQLQLKRILWFSLLNFY